MWNSPVIREKAVSKGYKIRLKKDGTPKTCMTPTSHDVTERNIIKFISVVLKILLAGNPVLLVTKPRLSCIKKLCVALTPYKSLVMFRFTIGSSDSDVLKFWEPGASSYAERLACLEYAYRQGFKTSVSCEPMLDGNIERVVADTREFVTDAIWLGVVNRMGNCLAINLKHDPVLKEKAQARAKQLATLLSDERIHELYTLYRDDPKIKWKDSLKKILGLDQPVESGLDI